MDRSRQGTAVCQLQRTILDRTERSPPTHQQTPRVCWTLGVWLFPVVPAGLGLGMLLQDDRQMDVLRLRRLEL
jgi:hypothetical protein